MRKPAIKLGLAAWLCFIWAASIPNLADAHADIASTTPGMEVELKLAPADIHLRFTQNIISDKSYIELLDLNGQVIVKGSEEADDKSLRLSLPPLADGVYIVQWRAKSVDTHITEGSFRFAVGVTLPAKSEEPPIAEPNGPSTPPVASGNSGEEVQIGDKASEVLNPGMAGMAAPPIISQQPEDKYVNKPGAVRNEGNDPKGNGMDITDMPLDKKPVILASPQRGGGTDASDAEEAPSETEESDEQAEELNPAMGSGGIVEPPIASSSGEASEPHPAAPDASQQSSSEDNNDAVLWLSAAILLMGVSGLGTVIYRKRLQSRNNEA